MALTLDAFQNEAPRWMLLRSHNEQDYVRLEPFPDIEIALGDLRLETFLDNYDSFCNSIIITLRQF